MPKAGTFLPLLPFCFELPLSKRAVYSNGIYRVLKTNKIEP